MSVKPLYFLLLVICLSCSRTKNTDETAVFPGVDQVDHYRLQYSNMELHVIFTAENISMDERKLAEILHHNEPISTADSTIVSEMETTPYFAKTTITEKKVRDLLGSFTTAGTLLASTTQTAPLCAPTYREILVLRKKKKICGFVKLCFECNEAHLVGAQTTDENINVDYAALSQLLQIGPLGKNPEKERHVSASQWSH